MEAYLGIDVGSVTTKFAVLNAADELVASLYFLKGYPGLAGWGQSGNSHWKIRPVITIEGNREICLLLKEAAQQQQKNERAQ